MRDDFCVFILTHGRPDNVRTYDTLMKAGYTGKVYIVIDDEDDTEDKYRERFGDKVLQFSKEEIAKTFDDGDNFGDRRVIVYARNACWELARQVGCKYFMQLDDDYVGFSIRHNSRLEYHPRIAIDNIGDMLTVLLEYYESIPALSIAMSQGGDHIGGDNSQHNPSLRRKCMNTFICSTDRTFQFVGRINEDVNTYTNMSRRGDLFFTVIQAYIDQTATQSNSGGMTDIYLDEGTYVKTFYSVMYSPSCVKVGTMGGHKRIHHKINWHNTAPKILRESNKRKGETAKLETAVRD